MRFLGRLLSGGSGLASALGGLCVIAMVLHVTADVVMRFLFNSPIPGTILAVSVFYMTAVSFLPLALSEERNAHISVEVLYELTGVGVRKALDALSFVISIGVLGALTLRTWNEAMAKYEIGASTVETGVRVLIWPSYFVLPVGFGLMLVVLLYKFACLLTGRTPALPPLRAVAETEAPLKSE